MLKKILVASVILALLGAAVLVLALFNINALVALYKPELERIASETLGTSVELGELNTSIFPNAKIEARTVKIGANNSAKHSLAVGSVALELQLRPLLSKELKVDRLKIDSPSITFVKSTQGFEVAGLAQKKSPPLSTTASTPSEHSGAPEQLKITLNGLSLRNGSVNYIDTREDHSSLLNRITLKNLDLDSSINLIGSEINVAKLDLAATLLDKHHLTAKFTTLSFDSKTGALNAPDGSLVLFDQPFSFSAKLNTKTFSGEINAAVKSFDLAKLAEASDLMALPDKVTLSGNVDSKIVVNLLDPKNFKLKSSSSLNKIGLTQADHEISGLSGDVEASLDAALLNARFKNIALHLDKQPISLQAALTFQHQSNAADLNLDQVKIFGGDASVESKLFLNNDKHFEAATNASGLSIAQLLAFAAPTQQARMSGTIDQVKVTLTGPIAPNVARAAAGRIGLSISKAALLGVNLAAKVLSKVNSIPLISGALSAYVPPAYQGVLNSPDTPIRKLSGNFALNNGSLLTKDLHIDSDIFSIDVDGTITLDSVLNLHATIFFTKDFSDALAKSIPKLNKVYAADGRLTFPLTIQGKPDALVIVPNLDKLIELAGKRVLKDGADQLLDQALKKTPGGNEAKKAIEGLLGF